MCTHTHPSCDRQAQVLESVPVQPHRVHTIEERGEGGRHHLVPEFLPAVFLLALQLWARTALLVSKAFIAMGRNFRASTVSQSWDFKRVFLSTCVKGDVAFQ